MLVIQGFEHPRGDGTLTDIVGGSFAFDVSGGEPLMSLLPFGAANALDCCTLQLIAIETTEQAWGKVGNKPARGCFVYAGGTVGGYPPLPIAACSGLIMSWKVVNVEEAIQASRGVCAKLHCAPMMLPLFSGILLITAELVGEA